MLVAGSFIRTDRDLKPHRFATLPRFQAVFDQAEHVVRLLLKQFDIAVAHNSKRRPVQHFEAAEEFRQASRHGLFSKINFCSVSPVPGTNRGKTYGNCTAKICFGPKPVGQRGSAAPRYSPRLKVRARMARIDRHRRQNGSAVVKKPIQNQMLIVGQFLVLDELNAFFGQLRADQFVPAAVLRATISCVRFTIRL